LTNSLPYNDNDLLALLAQDDRNAFELLYQRYWLSLYDKAYQRLKNSQQAEDIVQDIFVTLWSRRAVLRINNLPGYLHTAVRFRVFNYVKRDLASEVFFEPFEAMAAHQEGADEHLMEKEMLCLINSYADTLPDKRRQIFLLHLQENMSTKEIAGQLRISQKTVQNQLGNALHGLRTHIVPSLIGLMATSFF
jgi:RNA polymerase sigma-70 factor (family 1)